jgi:hypothetical protein
MHIVSLERKTSLYFQPRFEGFRNIWELATERDNSAHATHDERRIPNQTDSIPKLSGLSFFCAAEATRHKHCWESVDRFGTGFCPCLIRLREMYEGSKAHANDDHYDPVHVHQHWHQSLDEGDLGRKCAICFPDRYI